MKRKIMNRLIEWKERTAERLPMLLYGARQVGKTYVMRELGTDFYQNTIYVNFEADASVGSYFENNIHADDIIRVLEQYYHEKIIPGQTLIIFDEVQACERALSSLKYFAEEAPEYHVIAAGSLLGVALKREHYSFPVGKVEIATMYPMDYEEYLWAKDKEMLADKIREHYKHNKPLEEVLHAEAMREYYHYCIVGGMPAAVLADLSPHATLGQEEIRHFILDSYIADMAKYADPGETVRIIAAYDSLPAQLAKDTKKFQYKLIRSGARASQYGDAIDWLTQAGVVCRCTKCMHGFLPPVAYLDLSTFKLYYSDMGILAARIGMNERMLQGERSEYFRGIFAENYVALALRTGGSELLYWESDGKAEVDFLILRDDHVIPVECKAGEHVKAKSLMVYREKYQPPYCIRVSGRNFGEANGIKAVPLYAAHCI